LTLQREAKPLAAIGLADWQWVLNYRGDQLIQTELIPMASIALPPLAPPWAEWTHRVLHGEPTGDIVLTPATGTAFQQRVWQAIQGIPRGQTLTYGALARQLGSHPRAVGQALKRNPLPLVWPCHRVVGSHGQLGGYLGDSGSALKAGLLRWEGALS
jgi:O-6-methylguanine DNA methyltransferase